MHNNNHNPLLKVLPAVLVAMVLSIVSCARMGSPDGGWYDEKPPQVIATQPRDGSVNVNEKKISIYFDEYVSIDNATENVIISPPQLEQADIKTRGKSIEVKLKDSLRANTTYTIDFSNAIKDNNESNLMGNYTYSFSTGDAIDTMQVAGYVLDAETLEPVQGIQVGLYAEPDTTMADTTIVNRFRQEPMLRVSRTDEAGHFSIKGVKPGRYRVYALQDMDANFLLTPQGGEKMAFYGEVVATSVFDDVRQDTTWLDSLRIRSIDRVPYKHYMPDNVMLRAFEEERTERAFLKNERTDPERLSFYFTYGDTLLPTLRGLNFSLAEADYVLEASAKQDSLTYWLRDTALVNTDSLEIELTYRQTDTLGVLQLQTDTLRMMPKLSLEKRQKAAQKELDDWQKQQNKKKKRGEAYDSIPPVKALEMNLQAKSQLDPDRNITIEFKTPLERVDTAKIHLYIERDSMWYNAEYRLRQKPNTNIRTLELRAEWQPGMKYSFELDSAAFVDIYGLASKPNKTGLRVKSLDEYGSFRVSMPTLAGQNVIAQLVDQSDKLVKEVFTQTGEAKFFYLEEKTYYLRVIIDDNDNHRWDTGLWDALRQPEQVYYFPKEINCRVKWDLAETWDPTSRALNEQKPSKLRKTQSTSKRRTEKGKNLKRAQQLGIELPAELR